MLAVTLLEIGLRHLAILRQDGIGIQPLAVGFEELADTLLAMGLLEILDVLKRLQVGELPVLAGSGPDEAEVDVVEVHELTAADALLEQLIPERRHRKAFLTDRQSLGEPVRHLEIGLLEVEDVNQFVPEDARPVEGLA